MPLSEKQILSIRESTARFNVWVGAVRSGKTFASMLALIDAMKNGIDGDIMIIGVNRESIQRNILNDLYKLLGFPPPAEKTNTAKLYGRNIFFVGAHDEGAVRRIQGATLAYAYVDEATCIPAPFWRMLQSRLSLNGSRLFATCNPEGPVHWLKKDFIDRSNELNLKYWNFTLDDNPSLSESFKDDIKKEYTGMWYARYILGEWAVAFGLIYDGFDHLNIYEQPYNPGNYYVVGLDYGTTNATAAVLASISPRQWPQIRVEQEYYYDSIKHGRSKGDDELAEDIKNFIGYKNVTALYIDPAAASLKIALRKLDIPVIDGNNDVLLGIRHTSKFITNKNIVIHRSCNNLLEQLQSYSWDQKSADRGEDKPLKQNDHACDALRYLVTSAFPTGEFNHIDENLTIEQIRRKVYGDNELLGFGNAVGGYF